MPKFFSFVETSLRQQEYDFATTNFSSLGADKISNFVYIYNNYKAMIPYIRGYKILNFEILIYGFKKMTEEKKTRS